MNDDPHKAKDAFNYHLSACRIFIECAFGELVMRWGLLWRTLRFDLKKCAKIIQVGMLLHNYIVESRLAGNDDEVDRVYFHNFTIDVNDPVQQELLSDTSELPRPLEMIQYSRS
jgi:DDE superfamily endonuclease